MFQNHNLALSDWLKVIAECIEQHLASVMHEAPKQLLHTAMRYSVLAGGKRLRPALLFASNDSCKGTQSQTTLKELAGLLEAIHVYSLIHDDLPAMDDDALRRGKPACHIAFDEGIAILAGDALQAWAFERLANLSLPPNILIQVLRHIAHSIGPQGMALGQALDLEWENSNRDITLPELEQIHTKKTGLLLQSAITIPAILAQNSDLIEALEEAGLLLGMAFQVHDDILDVTCTSEQLGKPANSDINSNKWTFPRLMGIKGAEAYRDEKLQQAMNILRQLGLDKSRLAELAVYLCQRTV